MLTIITLYIENECTHLVGVVSGTLTTEQQEEIAGKLAIHEDDTVGFVEQEDYLPLSQITDTTLQEWYKGSSFTRSGRDLI